MSNQGQYRWIVLVNKSPRGPLTEAEVRTLLAQGVVRHNDLAYRVSVDDLKERSDWHLLWQFEEFDRRTPESFNKKKIEKEKREQAPVEEVVKRNLAELPPELIDIAPEELLPRSRAMSAAAEEAKWTQIQEDVAQSPSARSRSHLSIPRWVYGLLGGLALSFLFFRWIASKPFSTSRVTPAIPPPEATNSQPRAITPRGTASRPVSRPSTTPSHSISPVRDAMPSERPREPDSSAQRELDREREREDRDRDRERDGEQREEERPAEGDAVEARSNDDPNFEDSRAPQSKSANRPTFRRKAGGSIPGESGGAGSSDELREEPREEAPPANE